MYPPSDGRRKTNLLHSQLRDDDPNREKLDGIILDDVRLLKRVIVQA